MIDEKTVAGRLAFRALMELATVQYAYKQTVVGAVAAAAHELGGDLSAEVQEQAVGLVCAALPRLGFRGQL